MGRRNAEALSESYTVKSTPEKRKWFGLKRRTSEKKRIIEHILEKQEALSDKLTELADNRTGVSNELANTNKCIEDMTRKIENLMRSGADKKELDNELKRQLNEGRRDFAKTSEELKLSEKERHRLELEVCKLEAEIEKMKTDYQYTNKQMESAEDLLTKSRNAINTMKEERMDLLLEIQRQENIIRERSVDIQILKGTISDLKNEIEDRENRIERMREDRGKLLEYLQYKSQVYEDKLKTSWTLISQRDKLKGSTDGGPLPITLPKLNNETYQNMSANFKNWEKDNELERQKTRVLQLELQLYRRDRLVEILSEKLKQYNSSFSITEDPSIVAYLDDNWSTMTEMSDGTSDVISVSSLDEQYSS